MILNESGESEINDWFVGCIDEALMLCKEIRVWTLPVETSSFINNIWLISV